MGLSDGCCLVGRPGYGHFLGQKGKLPSGMLLMLKQRWSHGPCVSLLTQRPHFISLCRCQQHRRLVTDPATCLKVQVTLFTLIFVHFCLLSFPLNPSVNPTEKSYSDVASVSKIKLLLLVSWKRSKAGIKIEALGFLLKLEYLKNVIYKKNLHPNCFVSLSLTLGPLPGQATARIQTPRWTESEAALRCAEHGRSGGPAPGLTLPPHGCSRRASG